MGTFEAAFSDRPQETKAPIVDEPEDTKVDAPVDEPTEPKEPETPAEKPPEAPKDEPKPVKTVPQEALHAERERRRELEAKLAEYEKKPRTSVLDDEDKAFAERLSEATRPFAQKLFNMSVSAAKKVAGREDYQEVYDFMNEEVQKHPELMRDIDLADDPGELIYQLGKTRRELAEVGGDITKLREHATAKVTAELSKSRDEVKALKAEIAALKASQEKKAAIPSSLNAEPSGAPKDDAFKGPTPLKAVF